MSEDKIGGEKAILEERRKKLEDDRFGLSIQEIVKSKNVNGSVSLYAFDFL